MELRRPTPTGSTTEASEEMLHEAALRVQARLDAEDRLRRRVARAKRVAAVAKVLLLLLVLGLLAWLWQGGYLKSIRERMADMGTPSDPAPAPAATKDVRPVPATTVAATMPKTAPAPAAKRVDPAEYASLLAGFAGAATDYWKNARPDDLPGKDARRDFTGLVPDGKGGFALLRLEMGGGQPFSARVVGPNGNGRTIDKATFDGMVARTPYLVARAGRAYFCSPGKVKAPESYPVPPKDGAFNPAREEFGALMNCLTQVKARPPAAMYRVSVLLEKLKKEIPVATVGYGATVSRSVFEGAVRSLVDDADAVQMLLKSGKVRFSAAK